MKPPQSLVLSLVCALCACLQPVFGGDLKLTETADTLRISLRDQTVLEYVKTARPVPEGIEKHFSRSGYIHPIYTPTGQELTGDYPEDHAHQHALFIAWTKAGYDGQSGERRSRELCNTIPSMAPVTERLVQRTATGHDGCLVSFPSEQIR